MAVVCFVYHNQRNVADAVDSAEYFNQPFTFHFESERA